VVAAALLAVNSARLAVDASLKFLRVNFR
jgi:hypothetical protein